jgi:hypothetical protein
MTGEPHPQRCETCNFNPSKDGLNFDSCPLWITLNEKYSDEVRDYKLQLLGSFVVTTGYTGCASHSSAKSDTGKVLDELFRYIDKKSPCGKVIIKILTKSKSNLEVICPNPKDVPACKGCCSHKENHKINEACFEGCFYGRTCVDAELRQQQREG